MKILNLSIKFRSPIIIKKSWMIEVQKLADQGRHLEAIKLIKYSTGWLLQDSKEYFDNNFKSKL